MYFQTLRRFPCVLLSQVPPTVRWPPRHIRSFPVVEGFGGMSVDARRGFVIVSGADFKLYAYSLKDGSPVAGFGGQGSTGSFGRDDFDDGHYFWPIGDSCVTSQGTVIVVEGYRPQEVNVTSGRHVRFYGDDVPGFQSPYRMDCGDSWIAMADYTSIALLSWSDGSIMTRLGYYGHWQELGDGAFDWIRGLQSLSDGSGTVAADVVGGRLALHFLDGRPMQSIAVKTPNGVVECDGGFIVSQSSGALAKVSLTGEVLSFGQQGSRVDQFLEPSTLAFAVDETNDSVNLIVLDEGSNRVVVYRV